MIQEKIIWQTVYIIWDCIGQWLWSCPLLKKKKSQGEMKEERKNKDEADM